MTQYSINQRDRSQLEQLWQQPAVKRNPLVNAQPDSLLHQVRTALLNFFTGSQQIRIWTKSTKQGVVWFAYDPFSDQRIGHCSEEALRAWLETRHHQ